MSIKNEVNLPVYPDFRSVSCTDIVIINTVDCKYQGAAAAGSSRRTAAAGDSTR